MSDWMYTHNAVAMLDELYRRIYRNLDNYRKGRISRARALEEARHLHSLAEKQTRIVRESALVVDMNPKHQVRKRLVPPQFRGIE